MRRYETLDNVFCPHCHKVCHFNTGNFPRWAYADNLIDKRHKNWLLWEVLACQHCRKLYKVRYLPFQVVKVR